MSNVIGAKVLRLSDDGTEILPFGFGSVIAGTVMLLGAHIIAFPKWYLRLHYRFRRGVPEDELDAFMTTPRILWTMFTGLLVFGVGLYTLITTGVEGPEPAN